MRPDFPRTVTDFQTFFATENACRAYLMQSRWPEGFACPVCHHAAAYELRSRDLLKCGDCGHQTSVTAGTVMHGTRVPLRLWFWAAYLVATHTPGISAVQLQRQLGVKRYETAWVMLQKLRRAMVRPERDRIRGVVEVDETYVGGVEEGRRAGRKRDSTKAIVVAAVEVRGEGSGRIRMGVVEDLSASSLVPFVQLAVEPGSVVRTDGWHGYVPPFEPRIRPSLEHCWEWKERLEAIPTGPQGLLESQDVAFGHSSRRESETSPTVPERVRLSVQPPKKADGSLPIPARFDRPAHADHLQDVVCW